jgi:hypothetical protein
LVKKLRKQRKRELIEGPENIRQEAQGTKAELLKKLNAQGKRIAELEELQQIAQETQRKRPSVPAKTANIIVVTGRGGTIQFINHTMPGIAPEDAIGTSICDYVHTSHHHTQKKTSTVSSRPERRAASSLWGLDVPALLHRIRSVWSLLSAAERLSVWLSLPKTSFIARNLIRP